MKNLKIGEISSSGQNQAENTKIRKFPWKSRRLGSYANVMNPTHISNKIVQN